jgi:lipopolysaccharide heptosyltransferase I
MPEPRFLAVRLGSLGDIVHTFPAVAALRESFPGAEIVWLTHPRWKFLIETSGLASEVWTVDSRSASSVRETLSRLRKEKFQAAIDYQGLFKSATLPFLAGIMRRIGFSSETVREFGVPLLYTERVRVTSEHIAEQNGELSVRAGARQRVGQVSLCIPPEDESYVCSELRRKGIERYLVLSPGGGWKSKCWPAQRFGELAKRVSAELGLRAMINYGPGEENLAEAVSASAGEANPLPYCGSLGQLMALLKNARCVIAGDTGPLHLADALRAPVVALFGPTNPARNGPYFQPGAVLRAPNVQTTYKRHDSPHPSLLQITVDEVFDAMRRLGVAG